MDYIPLIALILNSIVVPLLTYVSRRVSDTLRELRQMNGRLLKLEEWRTMHEKQDDDRHEDIVRQLSAPHHLGPRRIP